MHGRAECARYRTPLEEEGATDEGEELVDINANAAEAGISGGLGGEAAGMGSQTAIRATPIALGGSGGGGLAALAQQRRLYH